MLAKSHQAVSAASAKNSVRFIKDFSQTHSRFREAKTTKIKLWRIIYHEEKSYSSETRGGRKTTSTWFRKFEGKVAKIFMMTFAYHFTYYWRAMIWRYIFYVIHGSSIWFITYIFLLNGWREGKNALSFPFLYFYSIYILLTLGKTLAIGSNRSSSWVKV